MISRGYSFGTLTPDKDARVGSSPSSASAFAGISSPSGRGWFAQWPEGSFPRQMMLCTFHPLNALTSAERKRMANPQRRRSERLGSEPCNSQSLWRETSPAFSTSGCTPSPYCSGLSTRCVSTLFSDAGEAEKGICVCRCDLGTMFKQELPSSASSIASHIVTTLLFDSGQ